MASNEELFNQLIEIQDVLTSLTGSLDGKGVGNEKPLVERIDLLIHKLGETNGLLERLLDKD